MSLSRKTALVIGITLISLIAILSVLTRLLLVDSFSRLEEADTRQQASRASAVLADGLDQLNGLVGDWSAWDDTYTFMLDNNDAYLKANIVDSTFINLRLNLILLVNTTNQVVFSQGFDFEAQHQQTLPADLTAHLLAHTALLHPTDINGRTVGLVVLPQGVLLAASRPILTGESTGPSHGTLIFGRWLDAGEIDRLAAIAHVSISALRWDDPALTPDDRAAQAALSDQQPIGVRPLNDQTIAGYTCVTDIDGQPVLLLRVTGPRLIYAQGQSTLAYFAFSLLAVGLAFSMMMLLLLERLVLSRLRQLNAGVSAIEHSGDQIACIPAAGRDELANLGQAINAMLDAVQHSAETLRASEEKHRLLIEHSQDIICTVNAEGVFTFVSPAWTALLGHPLDQVVGHLFQQFVHPDDCAKCLGWLHQAFETGQRQEGTEYRVQHIDGSWRWHTASAVPLKDAAGTIVGFEGNTRDITDRKRAEDELQANRRQLTDIIEFLPDATLAIDTGKRIIIWNKAIEEMTGMPATEMIGKGDYAYTIPFYGEARPQLMDLVFEDQAEIAARYPTITREGDTLLAEVFCNALYNHKGAWVIAKVSPLHDQSGNVIGAIESIRDITARKQADDALRELNATLEQRVADRTAELLAANLRLTELDHMKDEFMSRISHELRTPLANIKIYLELLETARPEKREKYRQTLVHEADRLQVLIEDVLIITQLSQDALDVEPDSADLNRVIEPRLAAWRALAARRALAFRTDLAKSLPPVRLDSLLTLQAVAQLINNAVSYTLAGSITLATRACADEAGRWLTVSVADTGPGITPDDLPHIFERFYRGRAAANYKTPGTGVGLTISRQIAEKLGGRLTVETQVGVGSTFTLWLPV